MACEDVPDSELLISVTSVGYDTPSSQAKCPILAYSNLLLGRIHILSETSNRRALSFASTNQIAPYRYVHFKYCWPQWQAFLVACAMVFCLEKKGGRFLVHQSVFINNCYKLTVRTYRLLDICRFINLKVFYSSRGAIDIK